MLNRLSSLRMLPFIIALVLFMEALDTTIINTAIPAMAFSLQISPVDLKIALISYLLSLAVFIPISGWVADKFGSKPVFIVALLVFTLSSFGCGLAHNLPALILARCLQGLGGSLTLPVGRLIIVRSYERHALVSILGMMAMIGVTGAMVGPVLGGFITHYFSWRWIFWVNVPVGLIALLLACYWLPKSARQVVPALDKTGFLLFGTGLAALIFGLSALSETTISLNAALLILLMATTLLLGYGMHSRTQAHPIIRMELFRLRTFKIAALGNLFSRLGFGGAPFLLPLLLQIGLGYSALAAGILMVPTAVGLLIVKPLVVHLLRRFGYKRLLIFNTTLVGLSLWSFSFISPHTPLLMIGALNFCFGFLTSLQYSSMNSLAYADMPSEHLSAATSITSTLQQFAQSFGVAISALLLWLFSSGSARDIKLTLSVLHHTFLAIGLITVLASAIFVLLHPDDGKQLLT